MVKGVNYSESCGALPRPPLWPCTSQPKSSSLQVLELSSPSDYSWLRRATLIKVISPSLGKFTTSDCQPMKSFIGLTSLSQYGTFLQCRLHFRAPRRICWSLSCDCITSQLLPPPSSVFFPAPPIWSGEHISYTQTSDSESSSWKPTCNNLKSYTYPFP